MKRQSLRRVKKLSLKREVVRKLSEAAIGHAAGGSSDATCHHIASTRCALAAPTESNNNCPSDSCDYTANQD